MIRRRREGKRPVCPRREAGPRRSLGCGPCRGPNLWAGQPQPPPATVGGRFSAGRSGSPSVLGFGRDSRPRIPDRSCRFRRTLTATGSVNRLLGSDLVGIAHQDLPGGRTPHLRECRSLPEQAGECRGPSGWGIPQPDVRTAPDRHVRLASHIWVTDTQVWGSWGSI
jgi:hypothetical protein